jgi:hypothetical protein
MQYISDNELLSRLASGEWVDDTVHDPLSQMFALLNMKRDRESINEWCVWLVKRDRDRTLKVCADLYRICQFRDNNLCLSLIASHIEGHG